MVNNQGQIFGKHANFNQPKERWNDKMLKISLRDKNRSSTIRKQTGVKDKAVKVETDWSWSYDLKK